MRSLLVWFSGLSLWWFHGLVFMPGVVVIMAVVSSIGMVIVADALWFALYVAWLTLHQWLWKRYWLPDHVRKLGLL